MRASLLDYLFDNASSDKRTAFSYRRGLRRKQWTHSDIVAAAFRFARELEGRDIGHGDRVILWSDNCPEWVAAFFGTLLRGAIVVPLDENSSPAFAADVFEQTAPKLLLHAKSVATRLDVPTMVLDDLAAAISHHSADSYAAKNVAADDIIEIVFTSGTTAEPKGVELSHANILANIEPLEREILKYAKWQFLAEPFRILNLLPLSHVFGQIMGIFVPQIMRAEVIFLNRFNPAEIIETIKRDRVAVLAAVPRVLEALQAKIEREMEACGRMNEFRRSFNKQGGWLSRWWRFRAIHRLFGLKFLSFVTGGASLSSETETFWRQLAFVVVQGYGMTETAALVSINNPFNSRNGSIGQVLGGQEVKIGKDGEILVRGGNISRGYWGGKEGGARDGWLHTGDIGEIDKTGRLFFKGRKKDVIVTSAGLKIFPDDLVAALKSQPEIVDAVVVGAEHHGEMVPVAAVIARQSSDPAAAITRANSTLAPYQQIRHWVEWPEPDFPRTPTQKVRSGEVVDKIKMELSDTGHGECGPSSSLSEIIAQIGGGHATTDDARLGSDLKLDSLSRVELLSAVEDRFQVDIDESRLTDATTVGEIRRMIRRDADVEPALTEFSFPTWPLRTGVRYARTIFYAALLHWANRLLCHAKVVGLENLNDVDGPVIFASNHVTDADPAIIMEALPGRFRRSLAIAMDGERLSGYRNPPQGTGRLERVRLRLQYWIVLFAFDAFPLPRRSGFRRSFAFIGEAMDRGINILIFPEGQLTKDGHLHKFRSGVGLLGAGCASAIVPVGISGLSELKIGGSRYYAPPGAVTVAFGRPIPWDRGRSPSELTNELHDRVASLLIGLARPTADIEIAS